MDNEIARTSIETILSTSLAYPVSFNIPIALRHNRLPDIKIGKINGVDNIVISVVWLLALAESKAIKVNIEAMPIMLIINVMPNIIQCVTGIVKKILNNNKLMTPKPISNMILNINLEK